ncbi:MAG: hypothetical protein ACE5NP_00515 [Anaerolineae bacterium]
MITPPPEWAGGFPWPESYRFSLACPARTGSQRVPNSFAIGLC